MFVWSNLYYAPICISNTLLILRMFHWSTFSIHNIHVNVLLECIEFYLLVMHLNNTLNVLLSSIILNIIDPRVLNMSALFHECNMLTQMQSTVWKFYHSICNAYLSIIVNVLFNCDCSWSWYYAGIIITPAYYAWRRPMRKYRLLS